VLSHFIPPPLSFPLREYFLSGPLRGADSVKRVSSLTGHPLLAKDSTSFPTRDLKEDAFFPMSAAPSPHRFPPLYAKKLVIQHLFSLGSLLSLLIFPFPLFFFIGSRFPTQSKSSLPRGREDHPIKRYSVFFPSPLAVFFFRHCARTSHLFAPRECIPLEE